MIVIKYPHFDIKWDSNNILHHRKISWNTRVPNICLVDHV